MQCFFCHLAIQRYDYGVCYQCLKHIPYLTSVCRLCGLPTSSNKKNCYHCRITKFYWQELTCVTEYQAPLKNLIHQLKFYQKTELAFVLSRLMFTVWLKKKIQLNLPQPDIVTCVPLHHSKYWSRGYNQAELLAKPIAKWLNSLYLPHLLHQPKIKKSQKGLSKYQRQMNILNSFECQYDLTGKSIAVIDDIVTTGNTVNEVSKTLKRQGAKHIQILCLCRTIL